MIFVMFVTFLAPVRVTTNTANSPRDLTVLLRFNRCTGTHFVLSKFERTEKSDGPLLSRR